MHEICKYTHINYRTILSLHPFFLFFFFYMIVRVSFKMYIFNLIYDKMNKRYWKILIRSFESKLRCENRVQNNGKL